MPAARAVAVAVSDGAVLQEMTLAALRRIERVLLVHGRQAPKKLRHGHNSGTVLAMHTIWFLVFDRFQLLDVSGPLQVFASANEELVLAGRKALYETSIHALRAGPVRSSSGVELVARALPRRLSRSIGSVFVPGGPGIWRAGLPAADPARARRLEELIAWVRRTAPRFSRMASVCTGAFVLARAGLLEGAAP